MLNILYIIFKMEITEIRNEFEKELINNGYKFFRDNYRNALRGIQKKITDEKGIKYFITAYHYNHSEQGIKNFESRDSYSFTAQFRIDKNGKDKVINVSFNAEFLPNEHTVETSLKEVEDFFEDLFHHIEADYYEY